MNKLQRGLFNLSVMVGMGLVIMYIGPVLLERSAYYRLWISRLSNSTFEERERSVGETLQLESRLYDIGQITNIRNSRSYHYFHYFFMTYNEANEALAEKEQIERLNTTELIEQENFLLELLQIAFEADLRLLLMEDDGSLPPFLEELIAVIREDFPDYISGDVIEVIPVQTPDLINGEEGEQPDNFLDQTTDRINGEFGDDNLEHISNDVNDQGIVNIPLPAQQLDDSTDLLPTEDGILIDGESWFTENSYDLRSSELFETILDELFDLNQSVHPDLLDSFTESMRNKEYFKNYILGVNHEQTNYYNANPEIFDMLIDELWTVYHAEN